MNYTIIHQYDEHGNIVYYTDYKRYSYERTKFDSPKEKEVASANNRCSHCCDSCTCEYSNIHLPANRRDRQLALAEKYMSELNYEAAVLAYRAAIEIDPKNVEAYQGAVEAYSLADNKDGFEDLYTDALSVVDELSDEELDATIERVKDIYLSAPNVYDDNEKTAEVLEKGYEVTDNDEDVKNSLVDTYEDIIDDRQNDDNLDSEKILDVCDRVIEIDKNNTKITDKRRDVLEEYLKTVLKNGDSDTTKKLVEKYKDIVPDVDYEEVVESCINDLFDNEDYETIRKLADELKEAFPDINFGDILSNIEILEQQAAQRQALLVTVFDYMSVEDYDSMLEIYGSYEDNAVSFLAEQEKKNYIYIPDDDGSHTGTGVGIYLFDNKFNDVNYYFYYGDFVNGIRDGNGSVFKKIDYTYKYIFTGKWQNDAPNGAGYVYFDTDYDSITVNGELVDGLWNGYTSYKWNVYDTDEYDLSFNAVNGIPDEVSDKEGYYEVSRNGTEYNFLINQDSLMAISKTAWDFDVVFVVDIDTDSYIFAFDIVYSVGLYKKNANIHYGETYGIVGFADTYRP